MVGPPDTSVDKSSIRTNEEATWQVMSTEESFEGISHFSAGDEELSIPRFSRTACVTWHVDTDSVLVGCVRVGCQDAPGVVVCAIDAIDRASNTATFVPLEDYTIASGLCTEKRYYLDDVLVGFLLCSSKLFA